MNLNYAEKMVDCPEWVQADLVKLYVGCPDKYKTAFDNGEIAIEWDIPDEGKKWWRFCLKR